MVTVKGKGDTWIKETLPVAKCNAPVAQRGKGPAASSLSTEPPNESCCPAAHSLDCGACTFLTNQS